MMPFFNYVYSISALVLCFSVPAVAIAFFTAVFISMIEIEDEYPKFYQYVMKGVNWAMALFFCLGVLALTLLLSSLAVFEFLKP